MQSLIYTKIGKKDHTTAQLNNKKSSGPEGTAAINMIFIRRF